MPYCLSLGKEKHLKNNRAGIEQVNTVLLHDQPSVMWSLLGLFSTQKLEPQLQKQRKIHTRRSWCKLEKLGESGSLRKCFICWVQSEILHRSKFDRPDLDEVIALDLIVIRISIGRIKKMVKHRPADPCTYSADLHP